MNGALTFVQRQKFEEENGVVSGEEGRNAIISASPQVSEVVETHKELTVRPSSVLRELLGVTFVFGGCWFFMARQYAETTTALGMIFISIAVGWIMSLCHTNPTEALANMRSSRKTAVGFGVFLLYCFCFLFIEEVQRKEGLTYLYMGLIAFFFLGLRIFFTIFLPIVE